jgi:hypothetical protein
MKSSFNRKPAVMIRLDRLLLFLSLIVLVAACSQTSDPGVAMLKYLEARVAADANAIRGLSCAAWEGQAAMQADSFRSMNAQLDNVTCTKSGEDGDTTLVTCGGQIVTTYNGENRTWALGTYQMIQEDGEWKMCGEAQ